MPSMQEFCALIDDSLTYASFDSPSRVDAIYPYDPDANTSRNHGALILCEESEAAQVARDFANQKLNLLVCGVSNGEAIRELFGSSDNVAATSLSFRKACSVLSRAIAYYAHIKKSLDAVASSNGSIHDLLNEAVAITEGKINFYVFSNAFTLIDSCVPNTALGEFGLQTFGVNGYGSTEQAELIQDVLAGKATSQNLVTSISDGDTISAHLLITCRDATLVPDLFRNMLARRILNILRRSYVVYSSDQKALQKLLTDMLVMIPKDVEPLHQRLNDLPYPVKSHIRFLIITKSSSSEAIWPMVSRLKDILPHTNMTVYDGCIVALLSGEDFLFRPKFDETRFEAFLEENDAHAVFTAPVKFIRGLRTVYIQAKELLPNIPLLMDVNAKRHVYFEDVFNLYRIHLCSMAMHSHLGHDKIIYLAHPVAIQLIRHDIAHNTDYFDFIVQYSRCGGNIQETAHRSHMHRNSAYNKLNKITELFDVDFSDGDLQRDMIFSMSIIRYNKMNPQDLITFVEPAKA